ncbi:MAG: Chlorosome protein, partial [Myxococcaceae bacterium]|nr:Chlorosome protein [Myxococcaceae bacterium]
GPATQGEIPRTTQLVGAPAGGPDSRPPAPIERTEISRPAPLAGPATHGEIPRATQLVGAPAGGPPSRPPGELPRSAPTAAAPTAAPASRPPAPVERTEISRPAPMAAAPPGVVARVPVPLGAGPAPAAYVPIPAATVPGGPFERPDAAARFAATTAVRAPGVPLPARMGSPAGPIIDPAPTVRPPQGPQVTPTPARQISPQDLTPSVPREAVAPARVATPPPQRAAPPPPTPPLPPPPRPALVVPPSFMDLPAAMEKPRTLGPEFATTQPGIPGPYSKPKPPPQPDPLSEEVAPPVPLGQDSTDTLADRPAVGTGSDLPVASDQVLAAPASLWRRALASIFDLAAIGGAVAGLLLLAVTLTGGKPVPNHLHGLEAFFFRLQPIAIPALGLTVLLAVLYTTLGAFLLKGRTLGRLLLGIRLVDSSGKSPGPIRSLFRAVFAIFSFALFLAGFWLAVFDRRGQTLHDKLTRTFVVRPV